jgi:glutathione S-transferase
MGGGAALVPLKLVIGNKAYSSWSMRPWLVLRAFEIPFDEVVVPLRTETTSATLRRFSGAAKVPVLIDGATTVWDSLAIIEYLAERLPDHPIWPRERTARAQARSLSAEMHAGFSALRRAYPMNMRRAPQARALDPETAADVAANVARLTSAWAETRAAFGRDGDFLFGPFSAADAMFAPIVNRFEAYDVPVDAPTRAYMDAIKALPAWRDWQAGAEAEGWRIEAFETL